MYFITVKGQQVTGVLQGSDLVEGAIEITEEQYRNLDLNYNYDYVEGELKKTTPLEKSMSSYELTHQILEDVSLNTELQLLSQEQVEAVGVDNLTNTDLLMMVLDLQAVLLENQKMIMNHLGIQVKGE